MQKIQFKMIETLNCVKNYLKKNNEKYWISDMVVVYFSIDYIFLWEEEKEKCSCFGTNIFTL